MCRKLGRLARHFYFLQWLGFHLVTTAFTMISLFVCVWYIGLLIHTITTEDHYLDMKQNYAGVIGMKVLIGKKVCIIIVVWYCMSATRILIIINVQNGSFNQKDIDVVPIAAAYLLVNYNRASSVEHIFYTMFTRFVCVFRLFSKFVVCVRVFQYEPQPILWPFDSIYVSKAPVKCIYVLRCSQWWNKKELSSLENFMKWDTSYW